MDSIKVQMAKAMQAIQSNNIRDELTSVLEEYITFTEQQQLQLKDCEDIRIAFALFCIRYTP